MKTNVAQQQDKSIDALQREIRRVIAWIGLGMGALGAVMADRGTAGFWLGLAVCGCAIALNAWLLLRLTR